MQVYCLLLVQSPDGSLSHASMPGGEGASDGSISATVPGWLILHLVTPARRWTFNIYDLGTSLSRGTAGVRWTQPGGSSPTAAQLKGFKQALAEGDLAAAVHSNGFPASPGGQPAPPPLHVLAWGVRCQTRWMGLPSLGWEGSDPSA